MSYEIYKASFTHVQLCIKFLAPWTLFLYSSSAFLLDLQSNENLTADVASYNRDFNGGDFGLQHFTYNNSRFLEVLFSNLESSNFTGIVVRNCLSSPFHFISQVIAHIRTTRGAITMFNYTQ